MDNINIIISSSVEYSTLIFVGSIRIEADSTLWSLQLSLLHHQGYLQDRLISVNLSLPFRLWI